MTDNKKISLTVQHAYSNESGYAFFSSDDRGKLGISAGDYVKIGFLENREIMFTNENIIRSRNPTLE